MKYNQVSTELDLYHILLLQLIQSKEKLFFVCHDISAPSNRKVTIKLLSITILLALF